MTSSVYPISLKFGVTSNDIILQLELVRLRLILEFIYAERGRCVNARQIVSGLHWTFFNYLLDCINICIFIVRGGR